MQETEIEDKNEILEETREDEAERVYELGYLLVPSISEENLPVVFGNLKELVSSMGGMVISDEMPKMMTLAYAMVKTVSNMRSKFNTAYFGWVKFTMDSDKILKLKKRLDLDPNFVRFLILKTVRENTINTKRFMRGEMTYRKTKTEKNGNEKAVPIDKEEIDKEIDAMVAV